MKNLRDQIDTNCPVIFIGNWPTEFAKGWRWATNLDLDKAKESEAVQTIQDYQIAHGKLNVALGHAFDKEAMQPASLDKICGLYVRDIEDIVKRVHEDLDNTKALAEWLNGDKQ